MTEKAKNRLISIVLADLVLAVVLLFVQQNHECYDTDCLVCSIIAFGFAIVGLVAILAVLFPISYYLVLRIKLYFTQKKKEEKSFEVETTQNVINNSLVKSFVKIQ